MSSKPTKIELSNSNLLQLYKKYGIDFVKILTTELIKVGKDSSGHLIGSLKTDLKPVAETIMIYITSLDYLTYVDKGRKPGSFPPIDEIKEWCNIKNIPESAAYGIAVNIYKHGIEPTDVIAKSVKSFKQNQIVKLEKEMTTVITKEAMTQIEKQVQKILK